MILQNKKNCNKQQINASSPFLIGSSLKSFTQLSQVLKKRRSFLFKICCLHFIFLKTLPVTYVKCCLEYFCPFVKSRKDIYDIFPFRMMPRSMEGQKLNVFSNHLPNQSFRTNRFAKLCTVLNAVHRMYFLKN